MDVKARASWTSTAYSKHDDNHKHWLSLVIIMKHGAIFLILRITADISFVAGANLKRFVDQAVFFCVNVNAIGAGPDGYVKLKQCQVFVMKILGILYQISVARDGCG